jgi:arabinofuranosyltransferase
VIFERGEPVTWIERAGVGTGLVLVCALMWPVRGYITDDTFIHLQYAKHLADGTGLVFNRGEPVYGCTSPLWVALIADGIMLGLKGLTAARLLGLLATLASVGLFMQLMRRTLRSPAVRALATVTWASHAWMVRWSLSGMETPLAVALTLAGFVAFTEGRQWGARPVRTGTLWALAALTRPEAVYLLVLWAVFLVIDAQNRAGLRRLVAGLIPPAVIYGSWLMFARVYFHTFWPQTLSAKAVGGEAFAVRLANLWRQARIVGATDGVLVLLLVLALLIGIPRLRSPRLAGHQLLPWVWVVSVPLLYVARGVPVISRYLLPLLPVLAWLAWRAAEQWWLGDAPKPSSFRRATAFGGIVAALAIAANLAVYRSTVVPQVTSFSSGLEGSLVKWGKWFGEYAPADARIATPDIGAIGYFSDRRVVDFAGLVTPEMVPLLANETQEDMIAHLRFASFSRPEFIVDRASTAYDLKRRSPFGSCLVPIGQATLPNLGIAHPDSTVYTFYRVDWPRYDAQADSTIE